jgi:hypothetical protein
MNKTKQNKTQYNASQLLTQREGVSRDIRRILAQRARGFNLILEDVSITQVMRIVLVDRCCRGLEKKKRGRRDKKRRREEKDEESEQLTPKKQHAYQTKNRKTKNKKTKQNKTIKPKQLTFSKEYTAAVEAKQVAQQEAERAKFVVEKAVQDKESAVVRAQVRSREEEKKRAALFYFFFILSLLRLSFFSRLRRGASFFSSRHFAPRRSRPTHPLSLSLSLHPKPNPTHNQNNNKQQQTKKTNGKKTTTNKNKQTGRGAVGAAHRPSALVQPCLFVAPADRGRARDRRDRRRERQPRVPERRLLAAQPGRGERGQRRGGAQVKKRRKRKRKRERGRGGRAGDGRERARRQRPFFLQRPLPPPSLCRFVVVSRIQS